MIARHEVIGFASLRHGQQERIVRIVGLTAIYQRGQCIQHDGAAHVVNHRADAVWLEHVLELGIAACTAQFIDLER